MRYASFEAAGRPIHLNCGVMMAGIQTSDSRVTLRKKRERQPKPTWLKVRAPGGERYSKIKERLRVLDLHTVCEEAQCPNIGECWNGGTATMMLMGDTCTRGCRFCAVNTGKPPGLDVKEPRNVAHMVGVMELDYVVLTSVNRDDLSDGGAGHFAEAIREIKKETPRTLVETLVPDFQGNLEAVEKLAMASPDVFAHNVETVERLQRTVRDVRAGYEQSLLVLRHAKEVGRKAGLRMLTKTSIMVGVGETLEEIQATLLDLKKAHVDVVTFGQYLQPSHKHLKVERFVTPEEFQAYEKMANELKFSYCASGPLVRSSYRAGEYYIRNILEKNESPLTDPLASF